MFTWVDTGSAMDSSSQRWASSPSSCSSEGGTAACSTCKSFNTTDQVQVEWTYSFPPFIFLSFAAWLTSTHGTVSRYEYWFLKIQKVFQKIFTTLYNYQLFICFFEISYLLWKCLLKPSSEFPSLWLVNVLQCRPHIGCRENVSNLLATGGFLYALSGSKTPL